MQGVRVLGPVGLFGSVPRRQHRYEQSNGPEVGPVNGPNEVLYLPVVLVVAVDVVAAVAVAVGEARTAVVLPDVVLVRLRRCSNLAVGRAGRRENICDCRVFLDFHHPRW